MKRKVMISFAVLCMIVLILCWMGIGSYSSSSAVQDLRTELETIYGTEYAGKVVGNGTEDMVFVVDSKSWFMTNWNLRNTMKIDYRYECRVIFTTYIDGSVVNVCTITYQAVDPMGAEKISDRAFLNLDSKTETVESK